MVDETIGSSPHCCGAPVQQTDAINMAVWGRIVDIVNGRVKRCAIMAGPLDGVLQLLCHGLVPRISLVGPLVFWQGRTQLQGLWCLRIHPSPCPGRMGNWHPVGHRREVELLSVLLA